MLADEGYGFEPTGDDIEFLHWFAASSYPKPDFFLCYWQFPFFYIWDIPFCFPSINRFSNLTLSKISINPHFSEDHSPITAFIDFSWHFLFDVIWSRTMTIQDFCKFREKTLKQFCEEKGYRYGYLRQIATGHVRPSPDLALQIEKDTGGLVTRLELLYPVKKNNKHQSCQ